jgi:hypothetical protein
MKRVLVGSIAAFLLLAQAATAPAPGKVVARVWFENVSSRPMEKAILRGNLPLPPTEAGSTPSLALAYGRRRLPTQVTVLTTYPGREPGGRPEIVELTARLDLPPLPGLTLDVVEGDSGAPGRPFTPGESIARLLASSDPLLVRGSDVFGNPYEARVPLGEAPLEFFRRGPLVETRIYAATMRPLAQGAEGSPALPALWRVRAYVTLFDGEDFLLVDYLFHNGPVREDVLGPFYFRDLEASAPEGFRFEVWKKAFGPTGPERVEGGRVRLPVVTALPDGKMHWVPDQACFTVRTALGPEGERERARRFLEERPVFVPVPGGRFYSWANPETARYDADKYPLPSVPEEIRAEVRERLSREAEAIDAVPSQGGKGRGFHRGALGWAFPYDDPYGGVTGGGGLAYVYEHETAATGHRRSMDRILLLMDRVWEREYHTLFFEDGRPFTVARHPFFLGSRLESPAGEAAAGEDPHPARNLLWRGYDAPPPGPPFDAHLRAVRGRGLAPDYEAALRGYDSFDVQHRARAFHMMAAFYLLGDAIARDHIVSLGLVDNAIRWKGLPAGEAHVAQHPGKGVPGGRADGWMDHTRAAAHNVCRDPSVRAEIEAAVARSYALLEKAQSPETGNFIRNGAFEKIFGGEADWDQAWESGCIMADGAKCALELFRSGGGEEVARRISRIFEKRARLAIGAGWNAPARAPFRAFRIGPPDRPDEQFVPPVGEGAETFYMGTPFAWFHELTGDRAFLDRALDASGLAADRERFVRTYFPNGMWTYLVWRVQWESRRRPFPPRRRRRAGRHRRSDPPVPPAPDYPPCARISRRRGWSGTRSRAPRRRRSARPRSPRERAISRPSTQASPASGRSSRTRSTSASAALACPRANSNLARRRRTFQFPGSTSTDRRQSSSASPRSPRISWYPARRPSARGSPACVRRASRRSAAPSSRRPSAPSRIVRGMRRSRAGVPPWSRSRWRRSAAPRATAGRRRAPASRGVPSGGSADSSGSDATTSSRTAPLCARASRARASSPRRRSTSPRRRRIPGR